jgi:hypothetical protein
MQNIGPIFILQPILVIIICSALLTYWYFKRRFHWMVLVYSLVAYSVAISLKYAVQIPTINAVILRKRWLFLIALPMGFVDFLVPFASSIGIVVSEAAAFALAVLSMSVACTP